MTLREILAQEIDCDVLNDYCDLMLPAIVGPVVLTEVGKKAFADILGNEACFLDNDKFLQVHIENDEQEKLLDNLCWIAAGYCSESTYNLYIGG